MFSLYILAMVLMVFFTLQDLKIPKRKKIGKRNIGGFRQKKDRWFRQAQKAINKWANRDFIAGVGLFGLLPPSILGEIEDSLPRASDRYACTISVPNMYHSLGRLV